MRTKRLILVLVVIFGVAITARWWVPALLGVLMINKDLIGALDSTISIVSSLIALISALGGYILLKDKTTEGAKETLDQRNRRILLNHVENMWIKGVLEQSLHGAALLELGIKEDPEAVTKYPWAIKKESTNETLPTGTSMLEIFDNIGMGRSLLILGAPGSGKTTMLLELARQLIQRARNEEAEPIPIVFNIASWTENFTLADWLAQELNNMYLVPRKTGPDWVNGNKLLLLLDGLDEVRREGRAKCVEAINLFRKEHGLTSLAVCSRSQDYEDLNTKLSFDGAIEVQPLTQKQIAEFFNRFGKEMAGIKQILKKDSALREMAKAPLFLSIMLMTYRDKQDVEILVSEDKNAQRKHLFDTYVGRMFERCKQSKNAQFNKQDVLHWLSWLAHKMIQHNQIPYLLEHMQPDWLKNKKQTILYKFTTKLIFGLIGGLIGGISALLFMGLIFTIIMEFTSPIGNIYIISFRPAFPEALFTIVFTGAIVGLILELGAREGNIEIIEGLKWDWKKAWRGLVIGLILGVIVGPLYRSALGLYFDIINDTSSALSVGLILGISSGFFSGLSSGFSSYQVKNITAPGQRINFAIKNSLISFFLFGLFFALIAILIGRLFNQFGVMMVIHMFETANLWRFSSLNKEFIVGLIVGLNSGLFFGFQYGGRAIIQHYILRHLLTINNLLPRKLIPFLDHCVDLIFLRRVGGGYIFVHRLLMEHFAEMYKET